MARRKSPGRREELLAAGERVFRSRGIEKATIEQVTTAAGVSKGTFYLYFRSKNELVVALRRRLAANLSEAVSTQGQSDRHEDWLGLMRRQLEVAADAFVAQAPLHEAVFHDDMANEAAEGEAAWDEEIVESLAELIRSGSRAGAFVVDDPKLTAVALFHAIFGLFHHALQRPEGFDRDRVLAAAWQVVSRVLSGEVSSLPQTSQRAVSARHGRTRR
jgi:AcrR family transcriptional regulator